MTGALLQLVTSYDRSSIRDNICNDKWCITSDFRIIDTNKIETDNNRKSIHVPREGDIMSDIYIIVYMKKLIKKPWKILKNIAFDFVETIHVDPIQRNKLDSIISISYKSLKRYLNTRNIKFDHIIVYHNQQYQMVLPINLQDMVNTVIPLIALIYSVFLKIDYNTVSPNSYAVDLSTADFSGDIFTTFLPYEIIKLIFSYLDENSWKNLYTTCRNIQRIFNQKELGEFVSRYKNYVKDNINIELVANYHYLNINERRQIMQIGMNPTIEIKAVNCEDKKLMDSLYNFFQ